MNANREIAYKMCDVLHDNEMSADQKLEFFISVLDAKDKPWTKLEDKFPEAGQRTLFLNEDSGYVQVHYTDENMRKNYWLASSGITHWQSLPNLPKEKIL